ncbi:DNA cytosine methyltransferase [Desulfocurvus vexinensis]|uniref:DNA cytosine methyltransferase n=1 Tax=Desulfocurvus vexinensis TaxID=399548 RepID=UPI003CCC455A
MALCAGAGGLELGFHLLFPGEYRTVCAVERSGHAASAFLAGVEAAGLPLPAVWSDLHSFAGRPWRGVVDIVSAGYPCQPFSDAGRRRGKDDQRHLWPEVRRIVTEVQPPICFFENVSGHVRRGLAAVHADLLALGYRIEAGLYSAAECGAPHVRARVFILAVKALADAQGLPQDTISLCSSPQPTRPGLCGTGVAYPPGVGHEISVEGSIPAEHQPACRGCAGREAVAHPNSVRQQQPQRAQSQERRRPGHSSIGSACPNRAWPWPANAASPQHPWEAPRTIEPGLGGATHGLASRSERLYLLGNGVVPVAAALAFVDLWQRLHL